MRSLLFTTIWLAMSTLALLGCVSRAHAQSVGEPQIKVALIYNFIMFAEWPSGSRDGKLSICAMQDSPLLDALLTLEVRAVRNRQLHILQLSEPADYTGCAVLVVDRNDRLRVPLIRRMLEGRSVLTILDAEDTNDDGAMIAMSQLGGRMVFDINTQAAQEARLSLSSKLLRLARKVR